MTSSAMPRLLLLLATSTGKPVGGWIRRRTEGRLLPSCFSRMISGALDEGRVSPAALWSVQKGGSAGISDRIQDRRI